MEAEKVAKYVIAYHDLHGDLISNKKLQKLLYYVEAWGLVYLNGIIDEDFEAWVYGPVVPEIYKKFKHFDYSPISNNDIQNYNPANYCESFHREYEDIGELTDTVLEKYGNMTSLQLELLSHSETPWIEARIGLEPFERGKRIISKKTMTSYYSSLIEK